MVEPISTGAALVGVGSWFANKLLGPSADGLGEQLKVFANSRWRKIFERAEALSMNEELAPLPPGFALLALQKSSFSEDDETLTEMWANLLLSASKSFENKHTLFVDILSQIGGDEARSLNDLVSDSFLMEKPLAIPVNLRSSIKSEIEDKFKTDWHNAEEASHALNSLMQLQLYWPGKITYASLPYALGDGEISWCLGGPGIYISDEILVRQQLLDIFSFEIQKTMPSMNVEGLIVTGLGIEFVAACRESVSK